MYSGKLKDFCVTNGFKFGFQRTTRNKLQHALKTRVTHFYKSIRVVFKWKIISDTRPLSERVTCSAPEGKQLYLAFGDGREHSGKMSPL